MYYPSAKFYRVSLKELRENSLSVLLFVLILASYNMEELTFFFGHVQITRAFVLNVPAIVKL